MCLSALRLGPSPCERRSCDGHPGVFDLAAPFVVRALRVSKSQHHHHEDALSPSCGECVKPPGNHGLRNSSGSFATYSPMRCGGPKTKRPSEGRPLFASQTAEVSGDGVAV